MNFSTGNTRMQKFTKVFVDELEVDKMFDLIVNPENIFDDFVFFHEKTQIFALKYSQLVLALDVIQSFNTIYYCFTFKVRNGITLVSIPNIKVNRAIVISGLVYSISFTPEASRTISEVDVSYCRHTDYPIAGYQKSIRTQLNNTDFILSFSHFDSRLLEWPYPTQCQYYVNYNGSRALCHDSCAYELSIKSFNESIYPGIAIFKWMKGKILSFGPNSSHVEKSVTSKLRQIETTCKNKCSQTECHRSIYVPQIESGLEADNLTTLATFTFTVPPTSVKSIPTLEISEFLTDVGSTFGFWLGISLLNVNSLVRKSPSSKVKLTRRTQAERKKAAKKRLKTHWYYGDEDAFRTSTSTSTSGKIKSLGQAKRKKEKTTLQKYNYQW